jgi:GNAT superfamily N-acetyltransferase
MKIQISLSNGLSVTEHDALIPGVRATTISEPHGRIVVYKNAPHSPAQYSIFEFVVDDKFRGGGIGDRLLKAAVRLFGKDLGGQASSVASAHLMYKNGFRMPDKPEGHIVDVLDKLDDMSSVYLRHTT